MCLNRKEESVVCMLSKRVLVHDSVDEPSRLSLGHRWKRTEAPSRLCNLSQIIFAPFPGGVPPSSLIANFSDHNL